ncbi:MAG: RNA-binding domain-containing protein [bacterium]
MLTKEDIISIVTSGEGYNAEFKVRLPNKIKEIASEVCAFANAAGGVILIGVNDKNTIIGTHIENDKRSSVQNSINEINPHIDASLYCVNTEGKEVWVVEVASGSQKPYILSGTIYVRQGPNSQKITSVEQMRDFFQQSDRIYFDEGQCKDFDIEKDFDNDFFEEFKISAGLTLSVDKQQIFNNLKLAIPEGSFKNGAVLFFAKSPESFFEKSVIRCVAFEQTNKTNIIDDKIYGGPLMHQYQDSMKWLKNKLNVRYEIEGSGPRKEIWEIPEVAFKEAIINALSHRDYYDKGGRITIELFPDRVEITNPGGLLSAISSVEFGKKSLSRNPLVFGLFERMDMVEQIGSGIGRIRDEIEKAGLPLPIFKTEGMFTVIFQRQTQFSSEKTEKPSEITDNTREKPSEKPENTRVNTRVKTSEKTENTRVKTSEKPQNTRVKTSEKTENTRVKTSDKPQNTRVKTSEKTENTRVKTSEKLENTRVTTSEKTREMIVKLIINNNTITSTEIAEEIGISLKGVEYHLANLKKKKLIERVGPDKGGYWKVLE